ncbi:MAG: hypothetical protein Q9196_000958 [Gyalolechia fulgens]
MGAVYSSLRGCMQQHFIRRRFSASCSSDSVVQALYPLFSEGLLTIALASTKAGTNKAKPANAAPSTAKASGTTDNNPDADPAAAATKKAATAVKSAATKAANKAKAANKTDNNKPTNTNKAQAKTSAGNKRKRSLPDGVDVQDGSDATIKDHEDEDNEDKDDEEYVMRQGKKVKVEDVSDEGLAMDDDEGEY